MGHKTSVNSILERSSAEDGRKGKVKGFRKNRANEKMDRMM